MDELRDACIRQSIEIAREAEGIDVVDTLPSLAAETRRGLCCSHPEGHWNARGHELAADLLIEALKAKPLDSPAGHQR